MISRYWHSLPLALVLVCGAGSALATEDGEFSLSLKNSDILSLIATVSRLTGKNFIVDPRVKAKVTVISSRPMAADALYEVFLSVLAVHGFSAIPSGDVIKIVPDVSAKQGPVPNLGDSVARDQLVTHVIRVNNVPAAQLVPILRPLVPQQGHLAAYASTNSLVITDRAANIKRLISIIRRIDRPNNEDVEIVRMLHASATEVVRILNALRKTAAAARGASTPGTVRLVADERTNSILIGGDRTARLRLRGLIASLDTPLESGGNTKVIYLKYANAVNLVTILRGVSAGQAKVGATTSVPGAAAPGIANEQGQVVVTAKRRSAADDGTSSVDIQADEQTNALIITAPPDEMRSILAVVRQLDIRRAQVLIEAIIAEISDGKSRSLGVAFGVNNSGGTGPVGFTNLAGIGDQAVAILQGTATTLGGGLTLALGTVSNSGSNFGFLIRAIAADAANNILSTPSLVTLDNEEAEIIVGQNVPFITGQTTSANNDNPFQTIERRDVGLTLRVKPQINEGNTIKMEISQEVSSIGSSSEATADIVTNKRSIKTTVLIEDRQTLVLGGLIEDTLRDIQEKVPLLGDIPFIGRLFQYRSTVKSRQNLMVFLHPTILHDRETADFFSSEKYSFLRSKQLIADEFGIGLLEGESPLLPEIEILFKGRSLSVTPVAHTEPDKGTEQGQTDPRVATDVETATIALEPLVTPETTTDSSTGIISLESPDIDMARIRSLHAHVDPLRTQITLETDRDIGLRAAPVFDPDGSLSFTLAKTQLGSGFAVPDGGIDRIRQMVVDQRGNSVYIHIVPTGAATFKFKSTKQNGAGNYRFVIDLKLDNASAEILGG